MIRIKTYGNALFSSILDEIFEGDLSNDKTSKSIKTPVHDVIENDNEYIIEILLAGIKKEDISIENEKDKLIIKAERKEKIGDIIFNRNQSYKGKYERIFTLPDNANVENINASLEDGILTIKIPKIENIKRKIEIK